MRALGAAVAVAVLLGMGMASCAPPPAGDIELTIDLPTDPALDPSRDPRLASLQLTMVEPGEPPEIAAIPESPSPSGTLSLGSVPPSSSATFSLAALAETGELLGFGRTPAAPVVVGRTVSLPLLLRKPYAYVGGGQGVEVYDTVASADQRCATPPCYALTPISLPAPRDLAPLPDGSSLLVELADSGTSGLAMISTKDHRPLAGAATVFPHSGPGRLALSPDGHWAAVPFSQENALSVLDLTGFASGTSAPSPVDIALPGPSSVVLTPTRGYALEGGPGLLDLDCALAAPSMLQPLTMAPASTNGPAIQLVNAATAAVVAGGLLYLAEPCAGQIAELGLAANGSVPEQPWAVLGGVQPLVLLHAGSQLYTAGVTTGVGAPAEIDELPLPSGSPTPVRVPIPTEKALIAPSTCTSSAEVEVKPDRVEVYDLSVSPDGQHAAMLAHVRYQSRGVTIGVYVVDDFDLDTYSYFLVDLNDGAILQRVRFDCVANDVSNPAAQLDCASTPEPNEIVFTDDPTQPGPHGQFIPAGTAVLDGAR